MTQWPLSSTQAPLSISFLIVGGGLSGLACAVALGRAGHDVTVLEKDLNVDGDGTNLGGVRLPPNGSKILLDWGLKDELEQITKKTDGALMNRYESGSRLGKHVWGEEMLQDCRGEYLHIRHLSLRQLLCCVAVSAGATIRWDTRVASIDAGQRSVTLDSGEVLRASIIVGADGELGVSRKQFMPEVIEDSGFLRMYHTTMPKNLMMQDPELAYFWEPKENNVFLYIWLGHGYCAHASLLPVGGPQSTEDFEIFVYGPPDGAEGTWEDSAVMEKMFESLQDAEPRIKKLMKMASPPRSKPVKRYVDMENWVHESGGMVLIGAAAHSMATEPLQGAALSLEDAAVLAKLFSHLSSTEQIPSLLCAFEDLRIPRCRAVAKAETDDLTLMTLPYGEMQAIRDLRMRTRDAAGHNAFEPYDLDSSVSERWGVIKFLFAYDAEEEAENWWVQWGLLAIRAKAASRLPLILEFSVINN